MLLAGVSESLGGVKNYGQIWMVLSPLDIFHLLVEEIAFLETTDSF